MVTLRKAAWAYWTFAGPAWTLFAAIILIGIFGGSPSL